MKHTRKIITGVFVIALIAAAATGVYRRVNAAKAAAAESSDTSRAKVAKVASASSQFDPNTPVPVEGEEAIQGDLMMAVNAAGQAASRRQTVVRAQVGGQVKSVSIRENSVAGSSQVLIAIDPTEYQLALAEAKANLRNAEASFREMTLGDDQNIKDAALRKERSDAARDRAHVESAEVAVMKAQMNLDRTSVKAPFGGRIANLKVVPGQFVNAGEELLTVQEMDPIRVDVQVLEGQIANITPGRAAEISFSAFPGVKFAGRVETMNPIVDQQTRTARVTVAIPNPQGRILPGMYARVTLAAQSLTDRLIVPRSAVITRDHGRSLVFVFVADSAGGDIGRAKWHYVTPGQENDTQVELVPDDNDPVHAGDIVLTAGQYSLTHDAKVKLTKNAKLNGGRPE
jgi:HlyD family secretion protein